MSNILIQTILLPVGIVNAYERHPNTTIHRIWADIDMLKEVNMCRIYLFRRYCLLPLGIFNAYEKHPKTTIHRIWEYIDILKK